MKSGKLKDRIQLYTVTTTADGEGGTTATYTLLANRWADVRQMSQNEAARSGMVTADNNYSIEFRRGNGETFDRTLQIRYNGKRLNVTSVITEDYYFRITASEKA